MTMAGMMGMRVKKKKNEYETERKDQKVTVCKQAQGGDGGMLSWKPDWQEVCLIDTHEQVQRYRCFGEKDYRFHSSLVAFDPIIRLPCRS